MNSRANKKQTDNLSALRILRFPAISKAIFVLALMAFSLASGSVAASPSASLTTTIPPGYSSEIIQVKFQVGTDVHSPNASLPLELLNSVDSINRLFTASEQQLVNVRVKGESRSAHKLPDLNLWLKIALKPGTDATSFIEDLKGLESVEIAEFAPLPSPLPADTSNFTDEQDYLDAATDGIDARYSWTIPGGNGSGITIYDVEYSWNQEHEDLSKASGTELLLNIGDSAIDPFSNNDHGTAVLGELVADNDSKGVTGISWGADIGLAPANTADLGYDLANAIMLAVNDGSPGDVILIEQQASVCGLSDYGPSEWISSVFDAIQTATANGFVVVEAAGNGNVDLDQEACGTTFDRSVRDSGAIIVGAGQPPGSGNDRERESFSSYGSRVDLQGWGSDVVTTGYGGFYKNSDDPSNPNFWYTNSFGGTSSASPIVAGAVANLQGISFEKFGVPLVSFQVRDLLVQTGSPQLGNTAENIGPRPNLRQAIEQMAESPLDLYFLVDLSGSFADDLPNFKAQAPDIISTLRDENPNTRFGLGSYEDYPISPFGDAASGDVAYRQDIDLTFDTEAVETVIAGLFTRSGGDGPQSQLPALYQAATGEGQDLSTEGFPGASITSGQQANFRDGSSKIFLLWTDASFHLPGDAGDIPYPGPSFVETADAINALDPPKVIGISSGGGGVADLEKMAELTNSLAPSGGVDCNDDGTVDIPEGEPLVCTVTASGVGIGEAIIALVEAAAEPVISIEIDIWPFLDQNVVIPSKNHPVPVAILSTQDFDATSEVDLTSLTFGETGDEMSLDHCLNLIVDINEDGLLDRTCIFHSSLTGLQIGDTEAALKGMTIDGILIEGIDSVQVLPSVETRVFVTNLRGNNEIPSVSTRARGSATLRLNADETVLTYLISARRTRNVTAIHIHCGAVGSNGPVGATLFDSGPVTKRFYLGYITAPDAGNACGWTDLDSIIIAMRSGDTYINVHTVAQSSGEIRGQIWPVDP